MERPPLSARQVMWAIVAVIAFILMADFNNRWNEKQRLESELEQVGEELAALEATSAALHEAIEYASSDAAVEEWAYQDGGLARAGDTVYVPQHAQGGLPTPTPTAAPPTEEPSNLEVWWSLFFDPEGIER